MITASNKQSIDEAVNTDTEKDLSTSREQQASDTDILLQRAGSASLSDVPAVFRDLHELGATPVETDAILKALKKATGVSIQSVRQQWLDYLVSVDGKPPERSSGGGRPLTFEPIEPWAEPVDGQALFDELLSTLRRYVATTDEALVAASLWIVFAHAHDSFTISPMLAISSPEKRCGKTTLLTLVSYLVPKALVSASPTAATIFRVIEESSPTFLLDEADTYLRGNEDLRGILNGGHLRNRSYALRCVGDHKKKWEYHIIAPFRTPTLDWPHTSAATLVARPPSVATEMPSEGTMCDHVVFPLLFMVSCLVATASGWQRSLS